MQTRAHILTESIRSRLGEADSDLREFIATRAWREMEYPDFTTWWEVEIQPTLGGLENLSVILRPEVRDLVLAAITAEDATKPPLQQRARTATQRATLVGENPKTVQKRDARAKTRSITGDKSPTVDLEAATAAPQPELIPELQSVAAAPTQRPRISATATAKSDPPQPESQLEPEQQELIPRPAPDTTALIATLLATLDTLAAVKYVDLSAQERRRVRVLHNRLSKYIQGK